ncbi:peptidylprolyl isomerase [Melioribacter sp. OK-6-Me]|uniref:peptidylprolyl isomerase n=1 Tax=unclassified Melioribacter TaxID=2627329 RepID=UPI003EDA0E8C
MRYFRYLFLLAVGAILLSGSISAFTFSSNDSIVVTYADKYTFTISELNKYIVDWLYDKKYKNREDVYRNALHDMLINQLKRMDFFDRGLGNDTNLIKSISRIVNEGLVTEYFKSQYLNKYTTEEAVKNVYNTIGRKVVYRQIELIKSENIAQQQLDSLEKKAIQIKLEIENGKDFNELIKKYSSNNNPITQQVDWKQALLDPVANVVFKLNEGDVRIINTPSSLKIVEITEVKHVTVEPYDVAKNEISTYLKNISYAPAYEEFENDKMKLIDENKVCWDTTALEQIASWSNTPDFYKDKYSQVISEEIKKGNNKIILKYDDLSVDYKKFVYLLDNILILNNNGNITIEILKNFLLEAVRTDMIVKKAERLNLKEKIFNAFTDDIVLKNQIVYLYNQAVIESKIPPATDGAIYDFYLKHQNDLYYQLEKRNILVMVFTSKEEAEEAYKKINDGIPFEKVKSAYLVKTYIKERNGEIRSLQKEEKPLFGKVAFTLNELEVTKPIEFTEENQKKYALIKCYKIRPEKQLTFEEAKGSVIEDYKNYHRNEIKQEVEKYLMKKYNPVVNEKVLKKLIDGIS